jgi:hypothetical protein
MYGQQADAMEVDEDPDEEAERVEAEQSDVLAGQRDHGE